MNITEAFELSQIIDNIDVRCEAMVPDSTYRFIRDSTGLQLFWCVGNVTRSPVKHIPLSHVMSDWCLINRTTGLSIKLEVKKFANAVHRENE